MLTLDDVIERFDGSLAYSTNSKEICQYIADLLKELKERREKDNRMGRGNARWLINSDGYYPYCSACMTEPKDGIMTDFCPSCGARMKGKIT